MGPQYLREPPPEDVRTPQGVRIRCDLGDERKRREQQERLTSPIEEL
jgi:hypothetical protein